MRSAVTFVIAAVSLAALACAPRPRMCTAQTDCASPNACVAGRCQPDKPNVKPAIDSARRIVSYPVEVAYLRRSEAGEGGRPSSFALGTDSAVLMLRFAVPIPVTTTVVEAYVVLRRSDAVDDDPSAISLHATRIVDRWEGRSTSWARQPRLLDTRSPATVVEPGGASLVRLDVRDLVRQWPRRDERDQGIAIVADNESATGTTFAFRSAGSPVEPFLELYLR